jgi:predicted GH43/DUF377 family glycosyl hydrolase
MPPDFTNRSGVPPTKLIVPGSPIPKPPSFNVPTISPSSNVIKKEVAIINPTDERTCWVQNSKNGDIINILPILYKQFSQSGQKQVLMVSKEYAGLLTGCSYIEPLIWEGDWSDLNGAILQAKETFKNVVSLSTFGKSLNLIKQTPSFALEQWRQANALGSYGQWPLIFDKRNAEREAKLVNAYCLPDTPLILFADHSQSSPFPHTDDLIQTLRSGFKDAQIIRLSEVKAEQVYDLLALYERASVLVSIETMHLHLAAAVQVPVVALVTDKPEMWHGTAWRKQFLIQCRYGDYESRKPEVIRAIQSAMEDRYTPEIEITGVGGYNLSSMDWNGQRIGVYRWHPKADSWRTELAAWTGTKTVKVQPPKGFEAQSVEDGRLFVHNGKLHLSYTVANQKGCVIQYAELATDGDLWRLENWKQPQYRGNDFTSLEKNWSFWSAEGNLFAAYLRGPEQIVLQLDGDKVVREFKTQSPQWKWGQVRGGTMPIEHKGLWLQFFHSSTRNNRSAWGWTYYLGALLMEKTPPFQVVSLSHYPILAATERYFPVTRWKPRILFPAGAIKDGEDFIVSMGVNDAATGRVKLTESDLCL